MAAGIFSRFFQRIQTGGGLLGKITAPFNKNKEILEEGIGGAGGSAVRTQTQASVNYLRSKGHHLDDDAIKVLTENNSAIVSAASEGAKGVMAKGKWSMLKWGLGVPGVAYLLKESGLAQAIVSDIYTMNENAEKEAGTTAWYHGILAFLKRGMEVMGWDKDFPEFHKMLSNKMEANKNTRTKDALKGTAESIIPDFIDGGDRDSAVAIAGGTLAAAVGGTVLWKVGKKLAGLFGGKAAAGGISATPAGTPPIAPAGAPAAATARTGTVAATPAGATAASPHHTMPAGTGPSFTHSPTAAAAAPSSMATRMTAPVGVVPVTPGTTTMTVTPTPAATVTTATTATATTPHVTTAATTAVAKTGGIMATLGKMGRAGAILAIPVGIGMTLVGSGEAQAAPSTTEAGATVNKGPGDLQANGAQIAATGASIIGTGAVISAATPIALQLGLRAAPGWGALFAAGDAIYNTANYALRGEFAKSGLSLVSGVGETVAGLGGIAGYATVGTAWREAVRWGGAKLFGEDNTIDHSYTVQAVQLADETLGLGLGEKLNKGLTNLMSIFSGAASPSQTVPVRSQSVRLGNQFVPAMP